MPEVAGFQRGSGAWRNTQRSGGAGRAAPASRRPAWPRRLADSSFGPMSAVRGMDAPRLRIVRAWLGVAASTVHRIPAPPYRRRFGVSGRYDRNGAATSKLDRIGLASRSRMAPHGAVALMPIRWEFGPESPITRIPCATDSIMAAFGIRLRP